MSQTDAARNRSSYEWFADRLPTAWGNQKQTIRWYFSPSPDGTTALYMGLEDGRWLCWDLTADSWATFRTAGDAVVYRSEGRWARLRRVLARR